MKVIVTTASKRLLGTPSAIRDGVEVWPERIAR